MMTQVDIGWVAGMIEGEGSILSYVPKGRKSVRRHISIDSVDKDIITKLQSVTGCGRVYGPYTPPAKNIGKQDLYRWLVADKKSIMRLLLAVYPLMGSRRKIQISKVVGTI